MTDAFKSFDIFIRMTGLRIEIAYQTLHLLNDVDEFVQKYGFLIAVDIVLLVRKVVCHRILTVERDLSTKPT